MPAIVLEQRRNNALQRAFRASLSKSQGREGWSVIFRHPLRTDTATGKGGRRVRKGLGTREHDEAQRLVDQLNEVLGDQKYWSAAAKSTAESRFDVRVVDIFYDALVPETWDFFAVRDGVIPLPSSESSDYRRVLLVGTTGSGKTTLVRQLLGTDPLTERFPSTSTAKTTVADTEIVLADGSYEAVVTFMPRDQVRDYIEECLSAAVLSAYRRSPDAEILRRLLNHIDQRFRLSYVLGTGVSDEAQLDDLDADELDFEEATESPDEDDEPIPSDLTASQEVLQEAVRTAKQLASRHAQQLREHFNANAEDERVIEEIFEDNLDHLLREDDDYFAVADAIMEEVERRFDFLTSGELVRNSQGWPRLWRLTTTDRADFLRTVSRFSSNYAPRFGTLLTPVVNGIRVAGPFKPEWATSVPRLVLLDGEGLGHTPDSASSLPTTVTGRFESADGILLVDNGAQPMQAAPSAVMRSVVAVGQASKLVLCFTHFDQVIGDNLPTFSAKEQHILASAENTLRTIGEQLGPWAERALRQRVERASFFVGGIQESLNESSRRGGRSIEQLRRMLHVVDGLVERPDSGAAVAVYDKTDLVLAIQSAAETFHDGWRARLGKAVKPAVSKEHWTRVKALTRRLAEGWADEYDTLKPVADLHLFLQQAIYKEIQSPTKWEGRAPTDDEKQAFFDRFVNRLSGEVMRIATNRLRLEPMKVWQEAYSQSGAGSSFVRASIIADRIYGPAAPAYQHAPVPDRDTFLKEVLQAVTAVAAECAAELR